MTEENKRLNQLLKEIEGKEKALKNEEKMMYLNMKVLHLGMQCKLYKIMLTWDFGLNALHKGKYKDIKESLDDDYEYYKKALKVWKDQKIIQEIPQVKEFVGIYVQWLTEIMHHEIVEASRKSYSDSDKEKLSRLITDYRDKLQRIYIDV